MNYGAEGTRKQIDSLSSKNKKNKKKASVFSFKIFLAICFCVIAVIACIALGMLNGILDKAPDIKSINFSPSNTATTIYDVDGNVIETLITAGSNRKVVEYSQMPKNLVNAFIAIEDERFWKHKGIDMRGIVRAIYSGITSRNLDEGASTITQQLIKNVKFDGGAESSFGARLERKIQEQYLAIQLEKITDKTIILQNYLNTINLGSNTLGVEAASERYFNKKVSELTLSECAVIASITQNPSRYNPITHPDNNKERRELVLDYMERQGMISSIEKIAALADTKDVYERIAIVNEQLKGQDHVYSYFTDALIKNVTDDLIMSGLTEAEAYNKLYTGGLQIYSTQNSQIQAIVDEEINNPANYGSMVYYSFTYSLTVTHSDKTTTTYTQSDVKSFLQNQQPTARLIFGSEEEIDTCLRDFKAYVVKSDDKITSEVLYKNLQPQASFVIMDQHTGYVSAISGGRGEKLASLSLNRATGTLRQPGSTFKVLAAFAPALDACGSSLASVYYDEAYTVGDKTYSNWWNSGYVGYANIRQGITYSMNIIALKAMAETVSPQLGFEYVKEFGITSLVENRENADGTKLTDVGQPLCLGALTDGVSNLELTAAYAAIANHGVYTKPLLYTKVLDSSGKMLINNQTDTHTVIKESTAFLLTNAMQDVVSNSVLYDTGIHATSPECRIQGMSTAGKSGTTTNNNDVWFSGFTPYYTASIWEGYDANYPIEETANIKTIWNKIMTRVHDGLPDPGFGPVPSGVELVTICSKCGRLAIENVCSQDPRGDLTYKEYFAKGTKPTEYCTCHKSVEICTSSGLPASEYCPDSLVRNHVYMLLPSEVTSDTADTPYALTDDILNSVCNIHYEGSDSTAFTLPSTEESSEESTQSNNTDFNWNPWDEEPESDPEDFWSDWYNTPDESDPGFNDLFDFLFN